MGTLCQLSDNSLASESTPHRVTAGRHANRMRRNNLAERVRFCQRDSWRYSRNYGYCVSRQCRNVLRGMYFSRRQTTRKTKYPYLVGITKRIRQCAQNRHAENVIRANHRNGLQHRAYNSWEVPHMISLELVQSQIIIKLQLVSFELIQSQIITSNVNRTFIYVCLILIIDFQMPQSCISDFTNFDDKMIY